MRKTTKILSLVMSLVMLLGVLCIPSVAADASVLTFQLNADETGYVVTQCDPSVTGSVVIPNTHNDLPITEIGECAFLECTKITSITIPKNVTRINDAAFALCTSVTSFNLPNTLTYIGTYAFAECGSLTTIDIPNSVTYLGMGAFTDCVNLKGVNIGTGIDDIPASLFENCEKLNSVTIPDNIIKINNYAFKNCTNLCSVRLGKNLQAVGREVFINCSLQEIVFPESFSSTGVNAFSNNKTLETIEFKGTPSRMNRTKCFSGCPSIKYIIFNDYMTEAYQASEMLSFEKTVSINYSTKYIGTGELITVYPNEESSYDITCIVRNDVNGDSVCDVLDAAYIALCVNDLKEPDEIETFAIDCDDNGEIDVIDYQNLINVILNEE